MNKFNKLTDNKQPAKQPQQKGAVKVDTAEKKMPKVKSTPEPKAKDIAAQKAKDIAAQKAKVESIREQKLQKDRGQTPPSNEQTPPKVTANKKDAKSKKSEKAVKNGASTGTAKKPMSEKKNKMPLGKKDKSKAPDEVQEDQSGEVDMEIMSVRKDNTRRMTFGMVLLIVGVITASRAIYLLSSDKGTTVTEQEVIAELRMDISDIDRQLKDLPNMDAAMIKTISLPTAVTEEAKSFIKEALTSANMPMSKMTCMEQENDAGTIKALYQVEGTSTSESIVAFLNTINEHTSALLVNEVYLAEATRVVGLSDAADTAAQQEYRIVIQDAYVKGNVQEPVKDGESAEGGDGEGDIKPDDESAVDAGDGDVKSDSEVTEDKTSSVEEDSSVPAVDPVSDVSSGSDAVSSSAGAGGSVSEASCKHVFDNSGISTVATHETDGLILKYCSICGYIEEEVIPHSDSTHTYKAGKCGDRVCTVCGAKEGKAAHAFGPWTATTEPTCYLDNYQKRVCVYEGCKEEELKKVDRIPHKWVKTGEKEICDMCGMANDGVAVEVG